MNFLHVQSLRIWDYPILIPVTGKQKARSLILAKRKRTRTWGSKWDSRSHPAFVGLEWEFLPFPPGTSKPTQLIRPQPRIGQARSVTRTRYHSQDPLGQTSVPACCTHCVNTGSSGLVSPFNHLCVLDLPTDLPYLAQPLALSEDFHTSWLCSSLPSPLSTLTGDIST